MGSKPAELSPQRAQALFDLLVHHQTYFKECVRFNKPTGIQDYGPPFDEPSHALPSNAPVLQTLLYRFVLPLPGVRSFSHTFWANVRTLLQNFAKANMSDSYDHAGLGLRRTLATGTAALLEYPGRGVFGRLPQSSGKVDKKKEYDMEDPDDLKAAWDMFLHEAVHGDMIDHVFEKGAETDQLKEHTSLVRATHEYMLIHLASVIHYIFVESPDAIYVQKLTSNILKLLPWTMIRQSLRYGNAATMVNAMTKLFLTKLSLTSFTNWMGWSNNPDDGTNLLQQIISTLLGWDIAEYQKKLSKIRKSENAPSSEHLRKLDEYHLLSGSETERLRSKSEESSKSLVAVIFEEGSLPALSDEEHTHAIEYLALCASMHDREVLSKVICHSTPDLITATIREGVAAYDPIFRAVHNAVDLSAACQDLEEFLHDFMMLFETTPRKNGTQTPRATQDSQLKKSAVAVGDIADVLRKHQHALHRFLHQVAKKGGDVTQQYREYAKTAAAQFKLDSESTKHDNEPVGAMTPHLNALVSSMPDKQKEAVLNALDLYAGYLSALTSVTSDRLSSALTTHSATPTAGPGAFLARWQQLLDATPTTPVSPHGKVRYGSTRLEAADGDDEPTGLEQWKWPEAPDVGVVVDALGDSFGVLLAELGREHWREALHGDDDVD